MKQKTFIWVDPATDSRFQPAEYKCDWEMYDEARNLMSELLSQRYQNHTKKYFFDRCVPCSIDCEEFMHNTNAICCIANSGENPLEIGSWNPIQREDENVDEYLYYTREGLPVIAGIYDNDDNCFVLIKD